MKAIKRTIRTSGLNNSPASASLFFQPKLTVNQPNDIYEQEADAMADKVMRMKEPSAEEKFFPPPIVRRKCADCESSSAKATDDREEEKKMQRKENNNEPVEAAPQTENYLSSLSGGRSLTDGEKSFFEPGMGYDFSGVRTYNDSKANESAREINALAYTHGNNIVFGPGQYQPNTDEGKKLLAHELAHVVQQSGNIGKKTIQRKNIDDFKTDLEAIGPDHKKVVEELFKNSKFTPLVDYVKKCPAGTIDFDVKRITRVVKGKVVDLFGGFDGSALTVNPKRKEHATNPLELVDTIVHELLHAILNKNVTCTSASNPFPLSSAIQDRISDPELTGIQAGARNDIFGRTEAAAQSAAGTTTTSGKDLREYLQDNYGPSASRPQTHYIDLNKGGLSFVVSIIKDIEVALPGIGKETVSFDNVELLDAAALLTTRSWLNNSQRNFSMGLFKNQVAGKRKIDASTFTDREYDISAIQVVESADSRSFDPNTSGSWGVPGGVWECHKKSRFTGRTLHTYVTGVKSDVPGGAVDYKIIQHT